MEKIIKLTTAGSLSSLLTASEKTSITKLTLTGVINARDFKCMRDELTVISEINLADATIVHHYGGGGTFRALSSYNYEADTIPPDAFLVVEDTWNPGKLSLTKIRLPRTIKSIGKDAFYYCKGLKEIVIPDGVTEIQSSAFQECINLEVICIGTGIKDIQQQAFLDCKNLKSIIIKAVTPPAINTMAFRNSYNHTSTEMCPIVYAPQESLALYEANPGLYYYKSSRHPQTRQWLEGMKALNRYLGIMPDTSISGNSTPPIVPPVEPPVDPPVEPPVDPPVTPPVEPPVVPAIFSFILSRSSYGRVELAGKRLSNIKYNLPNATNTFTFIPNSGYRVESISFNNTTYYRSQLANNKLTLTLPANKIPTLRVVFARERKLWNKSQLLTILRKYSFDFMGNSSPMNFDNWTADNL